MLRIDSSGRPVPALHGSVADIEEVVYQGEAVGKGVGVGRIGLTEQGQRGIAVAAPDVAKHLIIRAVFANDIENVGNAAIGLADGEKRIGCRAVRRRRNLIVGNDLIGILKQFQRGRHIDRFDIGLNLIQRVVGIVHAGCVDLLLRVRVAGIGSAGVGNQNPLAVRGGDNRRRVPAYGNFAFDFQRRGVNQRYGFHVAEGGVQRFVVGRKRHLG